MTQQTYPELDFLTQLTTKTQPKRIPSMPLDFDCLPADIITKELTKLNNPHLYRIYYLGPRPHHSTQLHKRYGRHWNRQQQKNQQGYELSLRSLGNHCFSNKQQLNCQTQFFYRAFEGMNPTLKGQKCYIFNAAFEGGNLDSAVKVGSAEFDLFLRVDSNTRGHAGWFYFSIKNGSLKQKIKLNLCNLKKHAKLYEQGMTPFVYSIKNHAQSGTEWVQGCNNVTFDLQPLRFDFVYQKIESYTYSKLSFEYQFQYENDEVFFAYCVPYVYSRLQSDVRTYCKNQHVKEYSLGLSLAGLEIPLLHITDRSINSAGKRYIIVTGRVHPAETNSSHQVHGLIEWLIGNSKQAEKLLKETHFFIIPMVNPDGVVLGNTRTSVSGKDLNRQFTTNNSELFPEVFLIKNFVSKLQRNGQVMLYIDFHGHSMRKNTFLYGPNYTLAHAQFLRCRLLPKIIQKIEPSFRYYSCSFSIAQYKQTTARAVMLNQLKIPYVYTIQSSHGLFYDPVELKTVHFAEHLWQKMGRSIGKAVGEFNEMMLELQNMAKERRQSRQTKKRDKIAVLLGGRPARQNNQHTEHHEKNKDYPQIYAQLMNEIKMGVENEKKMEEQADSDEYDEAEDIPNKKLSSFTNALSNYKKETKKFYKDHAQSHHYLQFPKKDLIAADPNNSTQIFDFNFGDFEEQNSIHDLTKNNAKKSMMQQKKIKATLKSVQQSQKRKLITDRITDRRSMESCSSKKSIQISRSMKKQTAPITLYPQKPRYSLLNRTSMFSFQANLQTIRIPKDLKILRREMKKGRLLISNLQESRLKFISLQQKEFQLNDKTRNKFSNPKISKSIGRPSSNCITSATVNLNEQVRLKPTQPYLHGIDNFISVNGENGELNGLMVRAVKRRR